jgi:hypothetical protein
VLSVHIEAEGAQHPSAFVFAARNIEGALDYFDWGMKLIGSFFEASLGTKAVSTLALDMPLCQRCGRRPAECIACARLVVRVEHTTLRRAHVAIRRASKGAPDGMPRRGEGLRRGQVLTPKKQLTDAGSPRLVTGERMICAKSLASHVRKSIALGPAVARVCIAEHSSSITACHSKGLFRLPALSIRTQLLLRLRLRMSSICTIHCH